MKHLVTVFFVLLSILVAGIGGQQYFDGSGNTPNSQHVEECSLTNCDSYAKCPHGWMELYTERYSEKIFCLVLNPIAKKFHEAMV